jgi:protein SCO1/2
MATKESAEQSPNGLHAHPKKGIYLTVAIAIGCVMVFVGLFIYGQSQPRLLTDSELKNKNVFLFENPRSLATFSLIDYKHQPFTPDELIGKWSLVFFGFTYCPDVCPTTLALLNQFYKQQVSDNLREDLQIILVSVDPARDTPAKLYDYLQFFNPNFIGLTGEFLALHRFASQLNIPFRKAPGGGENYTVEHSGNIAIINPRGHYIGFFRAPHELSTLNIAYRSIRASRDQAFEP